MSLFIAVLFVALTPGVLLTLPKKGSKMTVAVVHGLVFAVVFHLTHKTAMRMLYEGFQGRAVPYGASGAPWFAGTPNPRMAPKAPQMAPQMAPKAPYGNSGFDSKPPGSSAPPAPPRAPQMPYGMGR